jgi:hypothetical protein
VVRLLRLLKPSHLLELGNDRTQSRYCTVRHVFGGVADAWEQIRWATRLCVRGIVGVWGSVWCVTRLFCILLAGFSRNSKTESERCFVAIAATDLPYRTCHVVNEKLFDVLGHSHSGERKGVAGTADGARVIVGSLRVTSRYRGRRA